MSALANDNMSQDGFLAMMGLERLSDRELSMVIASGSAILADRIGRNRVVANLLAVTQKLPTQTAELRSLSAIAHDVAYSHGLLKDDLCAPDALGTRAKPLARARQEAFWQAYQVRYSDGRQRFSLPTIGRFFGGRDHTTVLHGIRAHAKRMLEDA